MDEFISELRQSNIAKISDVYYAILEKSGKLTIIPRAASQPPSCSQLGISVSEDGIMHVVICNGSIDTHNLKMIGKDEAWLRKILRGEKLEIGEVFFMSADDGKNYEIIRKEK
jgi:uncharacterized membrane protein YcaP (DUF421 family)